MSKHQHWQNNVGGKTEVFIEKHTTNCTQTGLGMIPGVCGERPATCHETAVTDPITWGVMGVDM